MKKNILLSLMCIGLIIGLIGCGSKKEETNVSEDLKIFDYMKEFEVTSTPEDINKIVGIDEEKQDSEYDKYVWKLSEDISLTVTYYTTSKKGSFKVDYKEEQLKNAKVDFSKYDEIKTALNSGDSLTYDEFVSKVGNVEGKLFEKDSASKRYVWVNKDGGYLRASFSESSGKCTFVSGRY